MYFEKELFKQVFIQKGFLTFIIKKDYYYFKKDHHYLDLSFEIDFHLVAMAIIQMRFLLRAITVN